eukprot:14507475-Alexandrium_andersonii.AAC.1
MAPQLAQDDHGLQSDDLRGGPQHLLHERARLPAQLAGPGRGGHLHGPPGGRGDDHPGEVRRALPAGPVHVRARDRPPP